MTQQELIELYTNNYPSLINRSDEEKWEMIQNIGSERGYNVPDYIPPVETLDELYNAPNTDYEADLGAKVSQAETNLPDNLKNVTQPEGLNNLLTSSLAEWGVENGDPFGIGSTDYYKYTHNNSMAGHAYKAIYGHDQYQYDDPNYDPGTIGHITSFFVSLGSPLDIASLAFGGFAGKGASRAAGAGLMKRWNTNVVKDITEDKLRKKVGTMNLVTGAADTGASLATFSGAHAALNSAATQKEETGEIDSYKVLTDTAGGMLESGIVGLLSGGLVKGPMNTSYAYAKLAQNPGLKEGITKALANPISQIGAEGVAFTTIPYVLGELGIPGFHSPGFEDFTWEEYLKGIAINTGIIGSMKLISRAGAPKAVDEINFIKTAYNINKKLTGKEKESYESIRDLIVNEGGVIPDELFKKITDLNVKERGNLEEQEYLIPIIKRIQQIQEKPYESWTDSDRLFFLKHGVIGDAANARMGMIQDFLKNKEEFFSEYEKVVGEAKGKKVSLSDKDKNAMVIEAKKRLETYKIARDMANKSAIGGEMTIEKPWAREDFSVEKYIATDGREVFYVKSKDTGKDFFEGLNFETKAEAEAYVDTWYETYQKDFKDNWKTQITEEANITGEKIDNLADIADQKLQIGLEPPKPDIKSAKEKLLKRKKELEEEPKINVVQLDKNGFPKMSDAEKNELMVYEVSESVAETLLSHPDSKVVTEQKARELLNRDIPGAGDQARIVEGRSVDAVGELKEMIQELRKELKQVTEPITELEKQAAIVSGKKEYTDISDLKDRIEEIKYNMFQIDNTDFKFINGTKTSISVKEKVLKRKEEQNKLLKFLEDSRLVPKEDTMKLMRAMTSMYEGKLSFKVDYMLLNSENKFMFLFLAKNSKGNHTFNWNYRFLQHFQNKKIRMKDLTRDDIVDFIMNAPIIDGKYSIFERANDQYIQNMKNITGAITGINIMRENRDGYSAFEGKSNSPRGIDIFDAQKRLQLEITSMESLSEAPMTGGNVRRNTLRIGAELTKDTGNEGYILAAELGSRHYMRDQEINRLSEYSVDKLIKQDSKGRFYIDTTLIKKYKTETRPILISEELAIGLKAFLNKGGSFRDINVIDKISKRLYADGHSLNETRAFLELRIRGKTKLLEEFSYGEFNELNVLYGHNRGTIDKIYLKKSLEQKLDFQQNIVHKSGKQVKYSEYISGEAMYQRVAKGKPPSVVDEMFYGFLQKQIKKNKGARVNITSEDLNYAGRYYKGAIDIVLGKADMRTWFHENGHRLEDYIYSIGDKGLIKMWESYKGRFGKEIKEYVKREGDQKKGESEWMADNLSAWAFKQEMPRSLYQRINNFVKRLWSKTKQALFGKESLNEKDIRRILGEKVWKGFETGEVEWGGMERFQMTDLPGLEKNVRKLFTKVIESPLKKGEFIGPIDMREWKRIVAEAAEIDNPQNFKFSGATIEELYAFKDALKEFEGAAAIFTKDRMEHATRRLRLRKGRIEAGIDEATEFAYLKAAGVENGKLESANDFQLKLYEDVVFEKIKNQPKSPKSRLDDQIKVDVLNETGFGKIASKFMKLGILPTFQVIEMLGLKNVSSKMHDHSVQEFNHGGSFREFEDFARRKLGKRKWDGVFRQKGYQDAMWTVDHERYIERRKEGTLTKTEEKFAKQAFTEEYLNADKPFKASEIHNFVRSTYEGQVIKAYDKLRIATKDEFLNILQSILTKSEYEAWIKKNPINWIEDGIYFNRSITEEFRRYFNPGSKSFEKYVKEQAKKFEEEMVAEKKGKITEAEFEAISEAALQKAEMDFHDRYRFSSIKYNSPHLLKRHKKLPEKIYIEELNKYINVYETKWETSGKKYFLGMAKLLANMEIFPEYVNVKGTKFPPIKTAIQELETLGGAQGKKYKAFVERSIEKQLGISEAGSPFDLPASFLERTASFLAKTQLSFPTSGFKNLLLGSQMTTATYGPLAFIRGILGTLSRENRDEIRYSGHTDVGIRHLDRSSRGLGIADKIFSFGLMKPTEDFNRFVAVLAGKNHFAKQVDTVMKRKPNTQAYKRADEMLRTFYKMGDKQIKLLKKYGMDGTTGAEMIPIERASIKRELDVVYQKANAMAHINTQGASLQLFMPEFAGAKGIKPLTLYKRMAYAASTNMARNTKDAVLDIKAGKPSGIVKLVMVAATPYLAGEVMLGTYYWLLGEDPPKENSDWMDRFTTTMWKGEFLGIGSDILSPFADRDGVKSTMYPAVANYIVNLTSNISGLAAGKKTVSQFAEDFNRQTFSLYNGYLKVVRKKASPYNRGFMKFNKLKADFEKEVGPDIGDVYNSQSLGRFSKYYRDLRDAWNIDGPTKEFARLYISMLQSIKHDYLGDYKKDGLAKYDDAGAGKAAAKWMSNFLEKTMQPNPIKSYDGTKIETKRVHAQFIQWLNKDEEKGAAYMKELIELEKEYNKRYYKFRSLLKSEMKRYGF